MRKEPAVVIHPSEFPVYLIAKIGKTPLLEFAKSLEISRQMLHRLLTGKAQPSDKILDNLNLEVYYGLKGEKPSEEVPRDGKRKKV